MIPRYFLVFRDETAMAASITKRLTITTQAPTGRWRGHSWVEPEDNPALSGSRRRSPERTGAKAGKGAEEEGRVDRRRRKADRSI